MNEREQLARVHYLRMEAHYGKSWADRNAFTSERWPADDRAWRQVEHGHPADSNVHMARWHLKLAKRIAAEGLA